MERSIPEVYVSDGHWHSVFIEKNRTYTILTVDKAYTRMILHVTQDFGALNVLTVSLGGIPPNQALRSSDPGKRDSINVLYKAGNVNSMNFSPATMEHDKSTYFDMYLLEIVE